LRGFLFALSVFSFGNLPLTASLISTAAALWNSDNSSQLIVAPIIWANALSTLPNEFLPAVVKAAFSPGQL
jgi:hypothetical protein